MKSISPMIRIAELMIGFQKDSLPEKGVRLMRYCVIKHIKKGVLLYNAVTKELILLKLCEFESLGFLESQNMIVAENNSNELIQVLWAHWFLVHYEFDEKYFSDSFKEKVKRLLPSKFLTRYTIFTTSACNARCYYCFETKKNCSYMDSITANKVAEFIKNNCGNHEVSLKWFGGEPLMNTKAINTICHSLIKSGVNFHSTITTNGYLFNKEIIKNFVHNWNLKGAQIALDGTADYYNQCKQYQHAIENPFEHVIRNIELLIQNHITVHIRMNVGLDNAVELCKLCHLLRKRFPSSKAVRAYPALLAYINNNNDPVIEEMHYLNYYKVQKEIEKTYLTDYPPLQRGVYFNHCMADSDDAITVLPNGMIGKCDNYINENTIGDVFSSKLNIQAITYWKEHSEYKELCYNCPIYPECILLLHCPTKHNVCSFHEQQFLLNMKKKSMIRTYEITDAY